ncbi:MAG: LON peptidase substrate-binding domain-containing protein [Candidatus Eremiobacterota bacterium]
MEYSIVVQIEGPLPLLVLPEVVLFPGIYMVLHISEPSLLGLPPAGLPVDSMLVVQPPGSPLGSLAQVHQVGHIAGGQLQMRVGGLYRVRFRTGEGQSATDVTVVADRADDPRVAEIHRTLGGLTGLPETLRQLHGAAPPGLWLDILAHHLPLTLAARLRLLEEPDVLQRGALLVHWLSSGQRLTPPPAPIPVHSN